MRVWVKPKLHTHKERRPSFYPLLHTSFIRDWLFSPIKWRCLLRALCPVSRPVTTLDCVLLKDKICSLHPDKRLKLILEPFSENYQELATLPNADYPRSAGSWKRSLCYPSRLDKLWDPASLYIRYISELFTGTVSYTETYKTPCMCVNAVALWGWLKVVTRTCSSNL
jgi:hypothetical protein